MGKIKKITAYTHVGDYGQIADCFRITTEGYSKSELEAYGIGTTEGISGKELLEENHYCWILVLHNERGILDWMISHRKE